MAMESSHHHQDATSKRTNSEFLTGVLVMLVMMTVLPVTILKEHSWGLGFNCLLLVHTSIPAYQHTSIPAYQHTTTSILPPAYYHQHTTTSILPAYYQHTTSILPAYYQHTTSILPAYYQHTTSILPALTEKGDCWSKEYWRLHRMCECENTMQRSDSDPPSVCIQRRFKSFLLISVT
jgi:hypothetical protein